MGPRASLDSGKPRPTGIRSPDPPARSSVAIPTELLCNIGGFCSEFETMHCDMGPISELDT
jgi:hypothetical protein